MSNRFTKRNHYNPCFWTAYWNPEYFEAMIANQKHSLEPRSQPIYTLNLRSKIIRQTSVGDVFFQKNLGKAEITPDSMKRFCKKYYPDKYEEFCQDVDKHPESVYLDFEDILTEIENNAGYNSLIDAVRLGGLSSLEHKGFLTCVLIIHAMRSYEMMTSMLQFADLIGMGKWEYFWLLKNAWANPAILARAVTPLALGEWTLYRTPKHTFPLPDSPIMISTNTLMVVISPRLLLEINLNINNPKNRLSTFQNLSLTKFHEFQLRSINNAFNEIVFHDPVELEKWRNLPEFQERAAAMSNPSKARELIHKAANRVILAQDGLGRVPPDFEQWVRTYFSI
jgi:hypothetical protein